MEASQMTVHPLPSIGVGWHISKIGAGTLTVGVLAAADGAILAALVAGAFTLVNTGLTIWLTGRQRERRRHHDEDQEDDDE